MHVMNYNYQLQLCITTKLKAMKSLRSKAETTTHRYPIHGEVITITRREIIVITLSFISQ